MVVGSWISWIGLRVLGQKMEVNLFFWHKVSMQVGQDWRVLAWLEFALLESAEMVPQTLDQQIATELALTTLPMIMVPLS